MRSNEILAVVALGAAGAAVVMAIGCSSSAPPSEAVTSEATSGTPPTPPPAFKDTTGEAESPLAYPAGPYGIGIGSTIANYDFEGFPDAQKAAKTLVHMSLAQFYNPHGKDKTFQPAAGEPDDRLYPVDSGFADAGKAKPVVINIDIASVWCGPCNEEAATILPNLRKLYEPCGGDFLLNLHDSLTPGTTATQTNLYGWTHKYAVNYPGVIDPSYKLDPVFVVDAFPNNIIVDTTTMKIVTIIAGAEPRLYCADTGGQCSVDTDCTAGVKCTPSTFWATYEKQLDTSRAGCTLK